MVSHPKLIDLVHRLTIPCSDNGRLFTRTERIERIDELCGGSNYSLSDKLPLAFLWKHRDFNPEQSAILLSSHIDSLYDNYHCSIQEQDLLLGTFDNSITNAVLVHLMVAKKLPPQVLVAFTGDEEDQSRGADQIVSALGSSNGVDIRPEFVIVLDVTEEGYKSHSFTIENLFIRKQHKKSDRLRFSNRSSLANHICNIFAPSSIYQIKDGDPDESWQYDEHDMNCLAFCLPIKTITSDMHDDDGVYAKIPSVETYATSLSKLASALLQK